MANEVVHEGAPQKGDVVVAIDFGSSRSAYAWTLVGNEDKQVEVEKAEGGTYCSLEVKVPTSVLIEDHNAAKPTVLAFGVEAEQQFAIEPQGTLLFRWFKMGLYKPFDDDPMIPSANGKKLALSVVLKACLSHIKEEALSKLKSKGVLRSGGAFDVTWVLTVPAIWSEFARHVMRRAAFGAGLIRRVQSRRLVLALEPECAAIAFMADSNRPRDFERGDQFMIVDCGGGTLDITTHKIRTLSPPKLEEVIPPTGGLLGATRIDNNFFAFLEELLGVRRFKTLKVNHPGMFLDLTKEWEEKKRLFGFDEARNRQVLLRFGDVLMELGIRSEMTELISKWNESHMPHEVKARGYSLVLPFGLMRSWFVGPVQDVVDKVADVITSHRHELNRLKHIVLAGGFSRCPLLQSEMKERFPNTVVSNRPDLLIVEGAAMFGARPKAVIQSRIAKYTYGIEAMFDYDENDPRHVRHEEHRDDGRLPLFRVHGHKGDTLEVDSVTPRRTYFPLYKNQTEGKVVVLATDSDDPFLSKSDDVHVLATTMIPLNMSKSFPKGRSIRVEFCFGDTEVKCHAYDMDGKHSGQVAVDVKRLC